MIELILAVGLAVLISAFCSVSEAVLYTFPWSLVERLKRDGRKSGPRLEQLRNHVEEPITAILTLNTVAHTAGAAVAGAAWAGVFGEVSLGWFAAGFTLIILIFSEIFPKTIGVVYAKQLAPALSRPLIVLVWIFHPAVLIVSWVTRMFKTGKNGPDRDEDDIRALVAMTRRAGVIKGYEEQSITNILSLDIKTVEQIMTPRTVVFSLPGSMTVAEVRLAHRDLPHSRFPVYEGDNPEDVVGMVFRRQVLESLADDKHDRMLSDLMRPVQFVLEGITLDRLLVKFLGSRMHLFVVLDEYGGMAGVVTLEDVLEEILGSEIVDETDKVVDMRELARTQKQKLLD
ncbi:MAG: hemolysin family protein [Proteobacteria bacterium]|nr:hemolysin family protein [Pseudomonadota bacterium]